MEKRFLAPLALATFIALPTLTQAATPDAGTITITPQIGAYVFEGNHDIEDDVIFGIAPGYFITRELAVEAVVQYIDTETDFSANNEDIDGWLYHMDLLYHFAPDNRLTPFIAAGLGGITLDNVPDEGDSAMQLNYGAGLKYALNDNLSLRGDLRHMVSFDDHYNSLAALVGLTYNFGSPAKPQPQIAPKPAPVQPAKPAPVKPKPAPAPPVILDTDGDGVYDDLDRCPDTPMELLVDDQGCPLTEEISVNLNVEFNTNKADIKSLYHSHFVEVAQFLKANPKATAVVEGHTDNRGSEAYNQQLSQQRAKAVRQYFIDTFGIAPERLQAVGYGEAVPIASNDTEAGRQQNRRVTATINSMRHKKK